MGILAAQENEAKEVWIGRTAFRQLDNQTNNQAIIDFWTY
jgi:hypothetical protein